MSIVNAFSRGQHWTPDAGQSLRPVHIRGRQWGSRPLRIDFAQLLRRPVEPATKSRRLASLALTAGTRRQRTSGRVS